jgi:quercetin dioxygenase-like cupin family protein
VNARSSIPRIDLAEKAREARDLRAWTSDGKYLRASLVSLRPGQLLGGHVNREVDVVLVTVSGTGVLTVVEEELALTPGTAVHVPAGVERSLRAQAEEALAVLLVHRRTAVSPSWRWRPRRRRPWEDPWEEIDQP